MFETIRETTETNWN